MVLLGGMALLEEVWLVGGGMPLGVGFEVSDAQETLSVALSSSLSQEVEHSVPSTVPCQPAHYHASQHDNDNGLNLTTVSQSQ